LGFPFGQKNEGWGAPELAPFLLAFPPHRIARRGLRLELHLRWPGGAPKQDEIYIIAAGVGVFRRGADRVSFGLGDFLFVPAGVSHAFEKFTNDFKTWVIFFGPRGGYEGRDR
jgi:hypothetical protein